MKRNFYIMQSLIESCLLGLLFLTICLDKIWYVFILAILQLISIFIFFILRKYKFKLPSLTYNRAVNIVIAVSVVVCMEINKLLLLIPFTVCVIHEAVAVRRVIGQKDI
jgi:hypothetical protein